VPVGPGVGLVTAASDTEPAKPLTDVSVTVNEPFEPRLRFKDEGLTAIAKSPAGGGV
jgi:hypothetical protein